ncbi:MAG: c-type cytochrome [Gammaproteobacteria bacterium]|nr:c-type cytochrome [Gammaproteobacteria bacterium]
MRRCLHTYKLLILLALLPFTSYAVDMEEIAEGGRIYDKWWVEMELSKPTTTHSAYPKAGKQTGANTSRCKECHGWDYRGREGAYSKGSHFTGIKGIQAYSGGSENKVFEILKDKNHQYDKVMLDGALKTVAKFVVHGQIDMAKYIDAKSKKVNGNARKGKTLFRDNCADCHNKDGRAFNLAHDDGVTEYIGTIANKNPWETLHKVRNGHPGAEMTMSKMHSGGGMGMGMGMGRSWRVGDEMPAMLTELNEQQQVDLLTYLQALPKK